MDLLVQIFCVISILLILLSILQTDTYMNYGNERNFLSVFVETRKDSLDIHHPKGTDISKYVLDKPHIKPLVTNYPDYASMSCRVTNALDIQKHEHVLSVLPEQENIIVFVTEPSSRSILSFPGVVSQNIPIYTKSSQSNLDILMALLQSHKLTYNNILTFTEFDGDLKSKCVMLYDTATNIREALEKIPGNFEFVAYEDANVDIIKLLLPTSSFYNYDLSILFPKYRSRFPVKRLMFIDNFVVCKPASCKGFEKDLYDIVVNIGQVETNNYYTLFFQYSDISLQYLQRYNKHVSIRDDLPILEQYQDPPTYEVTKNIPGFYDAVRNELHLENTKDIDNYPLVPWTQYILKYQDRDEENGTYVWTGQLLRRTVIKNRTPDNEYSDGRYRCYGDPEATNKTSCERLVDDFGQIKAKPTFWDRPCEKNEECPFYQKNKTYPNYRGGCNDGFCELPLGIDRLSYRRFNPSSKPICHGCRIGDEECCSRTKDYAFELDFYDRRIQKIV